VPLEETLAAFAALTRDGKIRRWGVSNFAIADMAELWSLPGGADAATNQVLYNLGRRGIEWDLLPWCRERGLPIMAYSPIEQGRLLRRRALSELAARRGATAAQIALAWLLRQDGVIVIPKAANPRHVRENRAALDLTLTPEESAALDRTFPPPDHAKPLEML
jgi:diketogulonate reductase-like aldo/keto reductase